jgi:hypothetical protein
LVNLFVKLSLIKIVSIQFSPGLGKASFHQSFYESEVCSQLGQELPELDPPAQV